MSLAHDYPPTEKPKRFAQPLYALPSAERHEEAEILVELELRDPSGAPTFARHRIDGFARRVHDIIQRADYNHQPDKKQAELRMEVTRRIMQDCQLLTTDDAELFDTAYPAAETAGQSLTADEIDEKAFDLGPSTPHPVLQTIDSLQRISSYAAEPADTMRAASVVMLERYTES